MESKSSIPPRRKTLFWIILLIILSIPLLILDLISLLPNYPYQSWGERVSSNWLFITILTTLLILIGLKVLNYLKERKLYAIKVPLQPRSSIQTIIYVLGSILCLSLGILLISSMQIGTIFFDLNDSMPGIIFLLLILVGFLLCAKNLWRELKNSRFYAIFDINGIQIPKIGGKIVIKWDEISKIGFQMLFDEENGFTEGWIYLAISFKPEKEKISSKINPSYITNKGILTSEQIKNYFGTDKQDLYITTSFLSNSGSKFITELIEYKGLKFLKFNHLVKALNEERYKEILKELPEVKSAVEE